MKLKTQNKNSKKTKEVNYIKKQPPRRGILIDLRPGLLLGWLVMEPGSYDTKPTRNLKGPSTLLKETPIETH